MRIVSLDLSSTPELLRRSFVFEYASFFSSTLNISRCSPTRFLTRRRSIRHFKGERPESFSRPADFARRYPPDQFLLAAPTERFDGALSGQSKRPAAAFFPMDERDRTSDPGIPAGGPFLVLPKPSVQIDRHSGVEGTVGAFQNVERPNGRRGRLQRRLFLLNFHTPEHAAIFRFHGPADFILRSKPCPSARGSNPF
jgi:hypothetical protein